MWKLSIGSMMLSAAILQSLQEFLTYSCTISDFRFIFVSAGTVILASRLKPCPIEEGSWGGARSAGAGLNFGRDRTLGTVAEIV